ncbi:hypothetical protein PV762_19415 [Mitsuaria sp. CC2]|uniref:hypothetical protein n=1 Tax=Mitsuaria sp. CC2 TaxID=3029186 RepID=UPI003B8C53D7
MTGIRGFPPITAPFVGVAKPISAAPSPAAAGDFSAQIAIHHAKAVLDTASGRPTTSLDGLLTGSRRPDIEAAIEQFRASRKSSCSSGGKPSRAAPASARHSGGLANCDSSEEIAAKDSEEVAPACDDEKQDAVDCAEHREEPPMGQTGSCGNGHLQGVAHECAPKQPMPNVPPTMHLITWHPLEPFRSPTSTARAQARRKRRPSSTDSHRADRQNSDADHDGT